MNYQQLKTLYKRYLDGQTTGEETLQLRNELAKPANQEVAESLLQDSIETERTPTDLTEEQQQRILKNIFRNQQNADNTNA